MNHNNTFEFDRIRTGTYIFTLLVLAVAAVWASSYYEQYSFNDVSVQSIATLLMPIFVISVFLERTQEVFVSAWRELKRHQLDHELEVAQQELARARQAGGSDVIKDAEELLAQKKWCVNRYKAQTRKHAFLLSLCGGVIISAVGVRILYPLMSWDIEFTGQQKFFFNLVDIFLTGGLIGGGSDGVHQVMNVITNRAKATNKDIELQIQNLEGQIAEGAIKAKPQEDG
jgi:hypothetical protein